MQIGFRAGWVRLGNLLIDAQRSLLQSGLRHVSRNHHKLIFILSKIDRRQERSFEHLGLRRIHFHSFVDLVERIGPNGQRQGFIHPSFHLAVPQRGLNHSGNIAVLLFLHQLAHRCAHLRQKLHKRGLRLLQRRLLRFLIRKVTVPSFSGRFARRRL